eukprot:CAMPEP_0170557316 /NCGR_PEP_ID=MMETSP0211-20121228/23685_1 /TAXON_ID=311385 /ORGANISM="Pseudokeronopsis sp., Strain OXSARD2" /LENGTH=72 /DNA_ID=CAMNT_0010868217 /DNA_START=1092 /DNA_END=1310 /DNA_ORIENTATION=+
MLTTEVPHIEDEEDLVLLVAGKNIHHKVVDSHDDEDVIELPTEHKRLQYKSNHCGIKVSEESSSDEELHDQA